MMSSISYNNWQKPTAEPGNRAFEAGDARIISELLNALTFSVLYTVLNPQLLVT